MDYTYLISITIAVLVVGVSFALFKIFKDKKVDETEKEELQRLIIDIFNQAVKLSVLKTDEELKKYCVDLIIECAKENNIKNVNEEIVSNAIDLLIVAMKKTNNKINRGV